MLRWFHHVLFKDAVLRLFPHPKLALVPEAFSVVHDALSVWLPVDDTPRVLRTVLGDKSSLSCHLTTDPVTVIAGTILITLVTGAVLLSVAPLADVPRATRVEVRTIAVHYIVMPSTRDHFPSRSHGQFTLPIPLVIHELSNIGVTSTAHYKLAKAMLEPILELPSVLISICSIFEGSVALKRAIRSDLAFVGVSIGIRQQHHVSCSFTNYYNLIKLKSQSDQ